MHFSACGREGSACFRVLGFRADGVQLKCRALQMLRVPGMPLAKRMDERSQDTELLAHTLDASCRAFADPSQQPYVSPKP